MSRSSTSVARQESWVDVMEETSLVVTDIGILSKKEKVSSEYTVIENTHDGKKANFPEGRLGLTTRYICYTKKSAAPQRGFVVVTELKVLPVSDKHPLGFLPLVNCMDDNTSKAFHSKQLLVRFATLEEATEAIVDLIVLSSQKKEEVPSKYKRLPEINGFSICYKIGPVPKKRKSNKPIPATVAETPPTTQPNASAYPINARAGSKKVRKAIDGLEFKLAQEQDLVKDFRLPEDFIMMNLQDIEDRYNVDFSKWRALVNQT